jgi:alcohol dehydrogenase class IV
MSVRANYNFPVPYRLGAGRISELNELARTAGMTRLLVVTDEGVKSCAWFPRLIEQLEVDFPVHVFSDVHGNPTEGDVESGLAHARQHQADGVILVGGGSPMDVGKCIALLLRNGGHVFDYEDVGDNWLRAKPELFLPMIAVPTTAGTGSEVGRCSVIKGSDHKKRLIFHPKMQPGWVLADPGLTVGLPPRLTAYTGLDAFVHSFEAFLAPGFHPMADGVALEGMRLVKENLPVAVRNGVNLDARAKMLLASTMGATAFQKGLGLVHAIAHPLGGHFDVHHGLANAVLLPYCMRFNQDAILSHSERIASHLGLEDPGFKRLLEWVLGMRAELFVPHALKDLPGVESSRFADIAADALLDSSLPTNPKPATQKDIEQVLEWAWAGDV